jgi:RNA 2',3'-cyclic 3'-phosphodiesterase
MEKIRTFIAVDFSAEMIDQIEQIINYFKTQVPQGALKWVETKNLHLTIKFLGDISKELLPQVENILKTELRQFPSFDIRVEELGMYPHNKKPRVIWLGIKGGEPLIEIHQKLERALVKAQIPPEGRAYSPHLTIARVRRKTDPNTTKLIGRNLSNFKVDSLGTLTIDQVQFYQSELTRQGPIYTRLLSVPLNQV